MTKDSIISRFNLKEPLYCFFPTFAVFLCKSCDPVTCETIIAMLKLQMIVQQKRWYGGGLFWYDLEMFERRKEGLERKREELNIIVLLLVDNYILYFCLSRGQVDSCRFWSVQWVGYELFRPGWTLFLPIRRASIPTESPSPSSLQKCGSYPADERC